MKEPSPADAWLGSLLLVVELASRTGRDLSRLAKGRSGLTLQQGTVLCQVQLLGGSPSISDLAANVGRANHSLTTLIDRLESKGMLLRQRSDSDRRVVHVILTQHGEHVLAEYRAATTALAEQLLGSSDGAPPVDRLRDAADTLAALLAANGRA